MIVENRFSTHPQPKIYGCRPKFCVLCAQQLQLQSCIDGSTVFSCAWMASVVVRVVDYGQKGPGFESCPFFISIQKYGKNININLGWRPENSV